MYKYSQSQVAQWHRPYAQQCRPQRSQNGQKNLGLRARADVSQSLTFSHTICIALTKLFQGPAYSATTSIKRLDSTLVTPTGKSMSAKVLVAIAWNGQIALDGDDHVAHTLMLSSWSSIVSTRRQQISALMALSVEVAKMPTKSLITRLRTLTPGSLCCQQPSRRLAMGWAHCDSGGDKGVVFDRQRRLLNDVLADQFDSCISNCW